MEYKIIVGIDTSANHTLSTVPALSTLKNMAAQMHAAVYATAVVGPDRINWPNDYDREWTESFRTKGLALLKKCLNESDSADFKMTVLDQPLSTRDETIHALVEFAENQNAKMLAIITHEKTNPSFLSSTSFTSELMRDSPLPLLIIDARGPAVDKVRRILFATDLAPGGLAALDGAISLAKRLDAELIIFSALIGIPGSLSDAGAMVGGAEKVKEFLAKQDTEENRVASAWASIARNLGVKVRIELIQSISAVYVAIKEAASDYDAELIAMSSSASPIASFFFGSTARELLSVAEQPVVILDLSQGPLEFGRALGFS
jgi:nucleotide-binding universal stress UspA family protein